MFSFWDAFWRWQGNRSTLTIFLPALSDWNSSCCLPALSWFRIYFMERPSWWERSRCLLNWRCTPFRSSLGTETETRCLGATVPIPDSNNSEVAVLVAGLIGLSCLQDQRADFSYLSLLRDQLDMISGSTGTSPGILLIAFFCLTIPFREMRASSCPVDYPWKNAMDLSLLSATSETCSRSKLFPCPFICCPRSP